VLLAIAAAFCSYFYLRQGSRVLPDWCSLTEFPEGYAGKIDIYGTHSPTEEPPPVSEEIFRDEFHDEEVFSLLETGTVSGLLERFGEPARLRPADHMYDRYVYTRLFLPVLFCMEYPSGIVFHIYDGNLVQIDFKAPGHFFKETLQVGSTMDEAVSIVGPPKSIVNCGNIKGGLSDEHFAIDSSVDGVCFSYNPDTPYIRYYPLGQRVCLTSLDGRLKSISFFLCFGLNRSAWRRPYVKGELSPPAVVSTGDWWRSWLAWRDCSDNLEALGESFRRYKEKNHQKYYWPALDSQPGRFMFKREEFFPAYISDVTVFRCPNVRNDAKNSIELLDDQGYWYFGYCIKDEREGAAFLAAYYDSIKASRGFEDDLPIPYRALSGTQGCLLRFREGVERFYIFEISNPAAPQRVQSETFVMVERPGHHWRQGGHVLFMDGHVEWMDYPGRFPMTPAFIEGLIEMEKKVTDK
jgi:prepilin-type processing-associated H-X9-DG protein